jgi:hypothetical protein
VYTTTGLEAQNPGRGLPMQLIIIRHAIAVPRGTPGIPDEDRPLTPEGEQKPREAAKGLTSLVGRPDALLTSPWLRVKQTAAIAAAWGRIEPWRSRDEPRRLRRLGRDATRRAAVGERHSPARAARAHLRQAAPAPRSTGSPCTRQPAPGRFTRGGARRSCATWRPPMAQERLEPRPDGLVQDRWVPHTASGGRERGTSHGAAQPAPRAGSRPQAFSREGPASQSRLAGVGERPQ